MKLLLCLAEKGIPYEGHYIDLHDFVFPSEPHLETDSSARGVSPVRN